MDLWCGDIVGGAAIITHRIIKIPLLSGWLRDMTRIVHNYIIVEVLELKYSSILSEYHLKSFKTGLVAECNQVCFYKCVYWRKQSERWKQRSKQKTQTVFFLPIKRVHKRGKWLYIRWIKWIQNWRESINWNVIACGRHSLDSDFFLYAIPNALHRHQKILLSIPSSVRFLLPIFLRAKRQVWIN